MLDWTACQHPHTSGWAVLLWRASLLALGCVADPKRAPSVFCKTASACSGRAAHASGSKLPRHGDGVHA
ncbi:hypothetical protein C1886_24475 [Pseudomonas sp. FW300-N1A1]|nr:hypothetical protein C1886_24475 [Pseudomonas sp. FW300-N1A1]